MNGDFKIYNPKGEMIYEERSGSPIHMTSNRYSYDSTGSIIVVNVTHVQKEDNGTYIYVTNNNLMRRGITLIVLGKISKWLGYCHH